MRRIGCTALLLVSLTSSFTWFSTRSSAALLAQDRRDQPTFQTGVELVQLDVSVLDDKRQPVRGLSAADFTVLENGVPRPVGLNGDPSTVQ